MFANYKAWRLARSLHSFSPILLTMGQCFGGTANPAAFSEPPTNTLLLNYEYSEEDKNIPIVETPKYSGKYEGQTEWLTYHTWPVDYTSFISISNRRLSTGGRTTDIQIFGLDDIISLASYSWSSSSSTVSDSFNIRVHGREVQISIWGYTKPERIVEIPTTYYCQSAAGQALIVAGR